MFFVGNSRRKPVEPETKSPPKPHVGSANFGGVFLVRWRVYFLSITQENGKETENAWEATGKQTNGEGANFSRIISGDKVRQAEGNRSLAAWIANAFALPNVNDAGIHQSAQWGFLKIARPTPMRSAQPSSKRASA